jgi:hypothetical protein
MDSAGFLSGSTTILPSHVLHFATALFRGILLLLML